MDCKRESFSFNYLGATIVGATIGGTPKKKSFWKPLTNNIKTKLSAWKCKTISKADRLILIKAVLDAIPTYWMGIHKNPSRDNKRTGSVRKKILLGRIQQK